MVIFKKKLPSLGTIIQFFLFSLLFFLLSISDIGYASSFVIDNQEYDRLNYIGIEPMVQLPGKPCIFTCIIYPVNDIKSVKLIITNPNRSIISIDMIFDDVHGKYVSKYNVIEPGKYYFFINVDTQNDGLIQSSLYSYWITNSYDDKDNDQMPDIWEEKFNLDSENPIDAYFDTDNDGYLNYEEYQMNTNPINNDIFENARYKLSEKQQYFFLSFVFYCILFLFSWFGMRREVI